MRILVTGGAGFIGSHLVDGFLREGHEVQVLDNLSTGQRSNLPSTVPLHVMDIRDAKVKELFEHYRPEVLCHHAAHIDVPKSVANPVFDAEVNIIDTVRLLEYCRSTNTKRVLFASTGGAIYGEQDEFPAPDTHPERPVSPYGVAKLSVERYLHYYRMQHGFQAACMRYANVYGPRQNAQGEGGVVAIFSSMLLSGKTPTIYGSGEQTRDFVYVEDIANANLAALKHNLVGSYNVGTGVETNVNQLYAIMAQATGTSAKANYAASRPGETQRSVLDASKLTQATGWRPQTAIAEGLKKTCDFFRSQHKS
ncbi:MAG TPA: NAD-dependent epimerase/dehydratase family protein [Polyangiaceae bacterium]|nr:NAD-dependent epimerase/dehydratase family protein [Polyangiaceae bacterium]